VSVRLVGVVTREENCVKGNENEIEFLQRGRDLAIPGTRLGGGLAQHGTHELR